MISYTFNFNGIEPIPKQSVKKNTKTNTWYPDPKGAKYQKKIRRMISDTMNLKNHRMIRKDKDVKITAYFFRKSKRRCDIDNLIKPTMDALSGIVFEDDQQVKQLELYKYIGQPTSGIYIKIQEIPPLKKKPGD